MTKVSIFPCGLSFILYNVQKGTLQPVGGLGGLSTALVSRDVRLGEGARLNLSQKPPLGPLGLVGQRGKQLGSRHLRPSLCWTLCSSLPSHSDTTGPPTWTRNPNSQTKGFPGRILSSSFSDSTNVIGESILSTS